MLENKLKYAVKDMKEKEFVLRGHNKKENRLIKNLLEEEGFEIKDFEDSHNLLYFNFSNENNRVLVTENKILKRRIYDFDEIIL